MMKVKLTIINKRKKCGMIRTMVLITVIKGNILLESVDFC